MKSVHIMPPGSKVYLILFLYLFHSCLFLRYLSQFLIKQLQTSLDVLDVNRIQNLRLSTQQCHSLLKRIKVMVPMKTEKPPLTQCLTFSSYQAVGSAVLWHTEFCSTEEKLKLEYFLQQTVMNSISIYEIWLVKIFIISKIVLHNLSYKWDVYDQEATI